MKKKLAFILAFVILSVTIFAIPVMANNGEWFYYDGEYYYIENGDIQTGWIKHTDGKWYYCDPQYYYRYDNYYDLWTINGKKYTFNADGVMQTGWQKLSGSWYYFSSSGAMQTGWQKIGGKWYYMNNNGVMLTGWQSIGEKWYYLKESGAMATGWQWLTTDSGGYGWFYLNSSGVQLIGWQKINGYWYYLNETAYTNTVATIGGKKYLFASSGKMLTGWQKWTTTSGSIEWFYFNSSGAMVTGWLKDGGKWYYLNEAMAHDCYLDYKGKRYYFNSSGVCTNP